MTVLIAALLLAIGTAAFALQNTDTVIVKFLAWEYQTSLVLVILGSVGSGIVLALLASLGGRWRTSRTRRSLETTVTSQGERIRELENQLRRQQETAQPPDSDS
ncbi:MAG: lipopolysaccharide assembly protein LapA domain-containing protein [Nitrospira sp.]|nr:lipopolysaccharide assembly protein LapA domain-containing protein [Nitrospira sp.]